MVPIAAILGRGEALTVAAMLDAAGIIVHLGGEHYASTSPHIVAMGGFRLTVPQWQHDDASDLIRAMLAEPEPPITDYARRAIKRLAAALFAIPAMLILPSALIFGSFSVLTILAYPAAALFAVPVGPRGRSDYFLSAPA